MDNRREEILYQEKKRQLMAIELLISSENFVSDAVMALNASIFTNKYAEGCPDTQGGPLMKERYEIYVSCMEGSGEYIKTFDEWINS